MASISRKGGVFVARFRYQSQQFSKSLKTCDPQAAEGALSLVKLTIHRLTVGLIFVPEGVDVGDFIVSGGTRLLHSPEQKTLSAMTIEQAVASYRQNLGHMAPSNRLTITTHLKNLMKKLGPKKLGPVNRVSAKDLESFIQARLRERASTTVAKERATVGSFFEWCRIQGFVTSSPASNLTKVKSGGDRPPFRTRLELEAVIVRGGLSPRAECLLWDCLYLSPKEVAEVLSLVRERAQDPLSYILHAIPAYSGMRRGEVMRLQWGDVEFERDGIWARSLKQSRQTVETKRWIDLHPELKEILLHWRTQRSKGQYLACETGSLSPLLPNKADALFVQPLRSTEWEIHSNRVKIGFHTYRHSFASNLAAAGVDQRVIDEFMGHTTEAMRKRYRHLFPTAKRSAIMAFSLATSNNDGTTIAR